MRLFKLWWPPIAWAGVIFIVSGIPYLKTELEYDYFLRKAAHVTEYFILTLLLYRAFNGSFKINRKRIFLYSACCSILYAASDEIHQYFVLGRHCALGDVLIDSLGVVFFLAAVKFTSFGRLKYLNGAE